MWEFLKIVGLLGTPRNRRIMEKKMEATILGLGSRVIYTPMMENQMEKKMENEMETAMCRVI